MDSIWNWTLVDYREDGRDFIVATKEHDALKSEIEEDSLHSLAKGPGCLVRGDMYLYPVSWVHGMIKSHYISNNSFTKQRKHVKMRDDDVVILTYPRSGTTWTEQLVLLLLNGADPSLLNTRDKNTYRPGVKDSVGKVFLDTILHGKGLEDPLKAEDLGAPWGTACGQDIDITPEELEGLPFRRILKTHTVPTLWAGNGEQSDALQARRFPAFQSKAKVVYVVRDPKDAAISWYYSLNSCNFAKHGWPFSAFIRAFLDGKVPNGSWFEHTKSWLQVAEEYPEQFLVIHFEDKKRKPLEVASRIAKFLEVEVSEEDLKRCVELSSFDSMKKMSTDAKAGHVRKGQVGGWKEHLSVEMLDLFNKKLNDPKLGGIGEMYKSASL